MRKHVAYFGPPDASRQYTKWKATNRDLLRLVPNDVIEVHILRLAGGGDEIQVLIDTTWAGLFDEGSTAGRQGSSP